MVPSNVDPEDEERRSAERRQINRAGLLELITANDHKHDEAHRRIRTDFRELEQRCEDGQKLLADKIYANTARLTELSTTPIDVSKVVFTPRVVFGIVAVVLSIWVGFWGSTSGLRSDVRDIITTMAAERRVSDANAKLLELNNATINKSVEANTREMKDALATISKRQDLLTLQYNELNSQITRLTAQREK